MFSVHLSDVFKALVIFLVFGITTTWARAIEDSEKGEALIPTPAALAASCGVERWSVKTGTDADAGLIDLSSYQPNTIATMAGWTKPATLPANNRILPYETTVWVITATLTVFKLESDSDVHMVLDDGAGHTMIAESADPACVGSGSPLLSGIQNARQEFLAKYTPTGSFQTANVPVQVVGVGMFDFLHGQTGVAPNGIELHAILDIIFNPSSTPDMTLSGTPSTDTISQGGTASYSLTTQALGGFSSAVSFSVVGTPSGVTPTFTPATIPAPGAGNSTLNISTACATTPGTYPLTITASGGTLTRIFNPMLTILAGTAVPDVGNTLQLDNIASCGGGTHPVISQIQTAGATASDEFVELFNPLPTAYDLTGHALKYRSAANNAGTAGVNFPAGTMIPANGYLLAATSGYTGSVVPDVTLTAGLAAAAGHLYLVQGTASMTSTCPPTGNVILDWVGYGSTAVCPEGGATAPAPATSQSIKRLPNNSSGSGQDTENNAADFLASSASTPRNSSTSVNCNGIILRWPAAPVDNYHVYRSDEPTMLNGVQVADLPQGVTQFSDAAAGSWFYRVFNYTACGGESGD